MPHHDDAWGLPVTSSSAEAVAKWSECLIAFLGMRTDIGDLLKEALTHDPEMPMGHITRALFMKMFNTAKMDSVAAKARDQAGALIDAGDATARERAHLAALITWLNGEMEEACLIWEAILIEHPNDVLAIKCAQLNRFYLGDSAGMRGSLARTMHAWGKTDDLPGRGYIIGSYGFSCEESGDYAKAERLGREAIEIEPADIWSAHAVAHVMEMQGRAEEGLTWLDGLKGNWGGCHNFKHHAHWHRALFALELGRHDEVLAIYDADVWTDQVADYLDFCNGAALLWRLEDIGVDIGNRWESVADMASGSLDHRALAFLDAHYAVALTGAGRVDAMEKLCDDLHQQATGSVGTQGRLAGRVTETLARAVADLSGGNPGAAADALYDIRGDIRLIGGSHAQRDLFERMLIAAAITGERTNLARALISERLESRPGEAWAEDRSRELAE